MVQKAFPCFLAVTAAFAALTITWAALEEQCELNDKGLRTCQGDGSFATRVDKEAIVEESLHASGLVANSQLPSSKGSKPARESIPIGRLAVLLFFCGIIITWILATIKWAVDGSLPARLAIWGFLPEAYAAISVRAVVALLRMKSSTTPVVLLTNCVTDAGAAELAEGIRKFGKKADLQALELPRNRHFGEKGLHMLVEAILSEGLALSELDLTSNPQLSDVAVTTLNPLLENKASKLTTLRLADCGLKASHLSSITPFASRLRLQTLDLSGNPLAGAGHVLAELMEAPVLEELALAYCGLELKDLTEIAEQLPYTSLRSIQLAGNGIGRAALSALADALPTSQIDELGLESNEIEAADLSLLGTAWAKRHFRRLSLQGNLMSQAEVASFVRTLRSMQA